MPAKGHFTARVEVLCDKCGTSFWKYRDRAAAAKRHYCSHECRVADMQGDRNPKWRGGWLIQKTCAVCSKDFLVQRTAVTRRNRGQYCSTTCKVESQKGRPSPLRKPLVPCKVCGALFKHIPGTRTTFCSKVCVGRYKTEKVIRHIIEYDNVRPGVSAAKRAQDRRRKAILLSFRGRHTEQQWIDLCIAYKGRCACCKKKRKLTRDHIIPIALGGGDEITNIQPLCAECNGRKGASRTQLL